jgi:hypothetical protein
VKPGYNLKVEISVGEKKDGMIKIKNFEDDGSYEVYNGYFVFSYK